MIQVAALEPTKANRAAELEQLGDEIAELAAHIHAATYELLVRLLEFDRRGGWGRGFRSCAHWLSWRTGIAPGAARERVRVARALERLPQVSDAMRRGQLSFAKVRAISRVATSQNEEALLEVARQGTAAHLEKIVRAWRRVDRLEEQRAEQRRHDFRYLSLRVAEDGMYELRGRLEPEVGLLLQRALEFGVESLYGRRPACPNPDAREKALATTPPSPTSEQRRADALGLIAERALGRLEASDSGRSQPISRADRFQVVVHVDAEALLAASNEGQSVLSDGTGVSAETSRRIACDASRVIMRHTPAGQVMDVGRRSRTVPPAIRRALEHRDQGCRFPGCGRRLCDAHHIVHWADGGLTRLDNTILLCRFHHRAVHEEGYRVESMENGEFRFWCPSGRLMPNAPPPPRLPNDVTAALSTAHHEHGLQINAWTPTPKWNGEHLDLDLAVLTLRGRRSQ